MPNSLQWFPEITRNLILSHPIEEPFCERDLVRVPPSFNMHNPSLREGSNDSVGLQPGETSLLSDEFLHVSAPMNLEHSDNLLLVGLQGPQDHRARVLSRVGFVVGLHLRQDEEVDYPNHAGEDRAEKQKGGKRDEKSQVLRETARHAQVEHTYRRFCRR